MERNVATDANRRCGGLSKTILRIPRPVGLEGSFSFFLLEMTSATNSTSPLTDRVKCPSFSFLRPDRVTQTQFLLLLLALRCRVRPRGSVPLSPLPPPSPPPPSQTTATTERAAGSRAYARRRLKAAWSKARHSSRAFIRQPSDHVTSMKSNQF